MTNHVVFDTNVLVALLTGNNDSKTSPAGSAELQRAACRILRNHPEARKGFVIHTSAWILGETIATLRIKGYTVKEAQQMVGEFVTSINGAFDKRNDFAVNAQRVRLSGKAIANDFYDDRGNPEMGDEGVIESIERIEAIIGEKVTLVTDDGRFLTEAGRRNMAANTVAQYVATHTL